MLSLSNYMKDCIFPITQQFDVVLHNEILLTLLKAQLL